MLQILKPLPLTAFIEIVVSSDPLSQPYPRSAKTFADFRGAFTPPISIDSIDALLFLFRMRFVWFCHNVIIDALRLFDARIFKIVNDVLSLSM